ncbi:MAG TPA: peptide chain release factor-like protein [Syntrophales bacterium]|nr:peptide chain release factor-like protein [Syntrophales bacterium]HOL58245.1 peptide chain release factor-like protein [Syntrophales bacterium]
MAELKVSEEDLKETFIHASGPGGQKVNKTATCVQLTHLPTGISVKCGLNRSQSINRFLARRLLLDKIEKWQKGSLEKEEITRIKIRRNKERRARRARNKKGRESRCTLPSLK